MKSLFISLLFFTIAQSALAITISLDEANSKSLYNTLAVWGTRMNDPAHKLTYESVTDVKCAKDAMDNYACRLHDAIHNADPAVAGPAAKTLYTFVGTYNGILCSISSHNCATNSERIRCVHYWNPKDNDLRRKYVCQIEGKEN